MTAVLNKAGGNDVPLQNRPKTEDILNEDMRLSRSRIQNLNYSVL